METSGYIEQSKSTETYLLQGIIKIWGIYLSQGIAPPPLTVKEMSRELQLLPKDIVESIISTYLTIQLSDGTYRIWIQGLAEEYIYSQPEKTLTKMRKGWLRNLKKELQILIRNEINPQLLDKRARVKQYRKDSTVVEISRPNPKGRKSIGIELGRNNLKIVLTPYDPNKRRDLISQQNKQRFTSRLASKQHPPSRRVDRKDTTKLDYTYKRLLRSLSPGTPRQMLGFIRNLARKRTSRLQTVLESNIPSQTYIDYLEKESPQRYELAIGIARKLRETYSMERLQTFTNIVGIPVVAFGNQSRVLEQTCKAIEQLQPNPNTLFVFLANYPAKQTPDATFSKLKEWGDKMKSREFNMLFTIEQVFPPVQTGNIRSAINDGWMIASNCVSKKSLNDTIFLVLDDDILNLPPNWIEELRKEFGRNEDIKAVATPFYFDSYETKTSSIPPFWFGERLRRNIAEDTLDYLWNSIGKLEYSQVKEIAEVFFGGASIAFMEPLISFVTIRGDAYLQIGGYTSTDETPQTVRLLALEGLTQNKQTISCIKQGLVTDAKRQLQAYMQFGTPSSFAWKVPQVAFQTDRVDPVRVISQYLSQPFDTKPIKIQLEQTFQRLGISDPRQIEFYLTRIGLKKRSFRLVPSSYRERTYIQFNEAQLLNFWRNIQSVT